MKPSIEHGLSHQPVENEDAAVISKGDRTEPQKPEEFVPVSPMGTEGCLWEEDFHFLSDEEEE